MPGEWITGGHMEAGRAAGKGQNSWGGKDETKSYGGADGATGLVAH